MTEPTTQANPPPKKKFRWGRALAAAVIVIFLLIVVSCIASIAGSDGPSPEPSERTTDPTVQTTESETSVPVPTAIEPAKPTPTKKAAPKLSVEQQECIQSAESYIDSGGYSKKGLITQLKYEGFSTEEAKYAVEHIGANWMNEAAESAESYMDSGGYSKKSLTDQLLYEGFTKAEAAHGVKSVGL